MQSKKVSPVARELRALNVSLENREARSTSHATRNRAPEGFVANVISTSGGQAVARLRGLRDLVDRNFDVSTGQFDLFALVVDGFHVGGFERLENVDGLVGEVKRRIEQDG